MAELPQGEDDKAKSPLSEMLSFLYTDPAALSIANASLRDGFKLARHGAQDFRCTSVKCKTTLARALGYPGHTGLIPSKGGLNLAAAADEDLRKLYSIPAESECWKAFKKQNVHAFKDEFAKIPRKSTKPTKAAAAKATTKAGPFGFTKPTIADRLIDRINALAIEERHGIDFSTGDVTLAFDRLIVEKIERIESDAVGEDWRVARAPGERPKSKDQQLVTLQLRPDMRNDPTALQKLDLDLGLGKAEGDLFIRECMIAFTLSGAAEAEPLGARKEWPSTLVLDPPHDPADPIVRIKPYGDTFTPGFTVTVTRGPLERVTAKELVTLDKLKVGDVIEARLIVRLSGLASKSTMETQ